MYLNTNPTPPFLKQTKHNFSIQPPPPPKRRQKRNETQNIKNILKPGPRFDPPICPNVCISCVPYGDALPSKTGKRWDLRNPGPSKALPCSQIVGSKAAASLAPMAGPIEAFANSRRIPKQEPSCHGKICATEEQWAS